MEPLPVGKLPASLLDNLLRRYVRPDPSIIFGPGIGRDAAVIDLGDRYLVAKSDPVTLAIDEIGWYAVHVNANDVACCGAVPRWFLATILLPEGHTTPALAEMIFAQIAETCNSLGIALCGGHTEVTYGLKRPLVIGHLLGEATPETFVPPGNACEGDRIILTKALAIEGTALLAREKTHELRGVMTSEELKQCRSLLHTPGISVVRDAQVASAAARIHAFHDPTEGGLARGLWELAQAAGVGCIVEEEHIAVLPQTSGICRHFKLDPLGLIASGSLLIVTAAKDAEVAVRRLNVEGIAAAIIGEITSAQKGCLLRTADGLLRPLPRMERDEICRILS